MKLLFISLLLTLTSVALANQNKVTAWGGKISLKKAVDIDYAIDNIAKVSKSEVLISGEVDKVCRKKGCWMTIKGQRENVRITFKDYGFFVPFSLVGKKIMAQGRISEKIMSVKDARHFAKDAGKSTSEIEKITQLVREYRFVASAVSLAENR